MLTELCGENTDARKHSRISSDIGYICELRRVSTAASMLGLLCRAPTMSSLRRSGNMVVTCVISASLGTRMPAAARPVRPVNSSTHSRMTEGPGSPGAAATSWVSRRSASLGTVETTSMFSCGRGGTRGPDGSSGSARLDRRGGLVEPMRGSRYREENRRTDGGMR